MGQELRFEGKVAIVTGAGGGLGRAHALLLASRGARVIVNDLGGAATGGGRSSSAADKVVTEIRAAGGEAAASYDSVEDGAKIVQAALDTFGRIDIVINNAGILRDTTFHKMTAEDWELIYRVHVLGAFRVTHAAWPHLRDQGYGRVVMTSSAAGIYGNFGQANYGSAKLGLVGFAHTLALEGAKKNVHVNAIAPIAGSRLTETILPKEIVDALKPEYVSPLVAWLCHDSCEENGGLFEVGGGFFAKLRWERAAGQMFRVGRAITPELIAGHARDITGFEKCTHPASVAESMAPVMENLQAGPSKGGNELIDVDLALGYAFPPIEEPYDEKRLALYALGVGAGSNPLDQQELRFVYELHGDGFLALPTYAVVPAVNAFLTLAKEGKQAPGFNFGLDRLLHGEQLTRLERPLPIKAKLTQKARIKEIWDKGKNAVVVIEVKSHDEDGDLLITNELTALIRGAGGWGGERGPTGESDLPPDRAPDATVSEVIGPSQALLYRLSGDWNPLHADPSFAQAVGFARPILHGLCTFGYAGRHVIRSFTPDRPERFRSIKVRFADSVYPGETVITEMWRQSATRIVFRCRVKERDKVVISNASVELWEEVPKPKARAKPAAAPAAPAAAPETAGEATVADVFVAIRDHLERNKDLPKKIGNVFLFKLSQPESAWTLDLKNGEGAVHPGTVGSADCTLELSTEDFMGMTSGKLDPQKLFFQGKLKISGNLMASQKLSFLQKIDPEQARAAVLKARGAGGAGAGPAATPPAAATGAQRPAEAPEILEQLARRLEGRGDLAAEIGGVLQLVLTAPDGAWVIDGPARSIRAGTDAKAQAKITLGEEDFLALLRGTADTRDLFQRGRLRIDGDLRAGQRIELLKKLGS